MLQRGKFDAVQHNAKLGRSLSSNSLGLIMATATASPRPSLRPGNPRFSSGPCSKRPGWSPAVLKAAFLGRSHRAAAGKALLGEVITRSRRILGLPDDYRLAIVPA